MRVLHIVPSLTVDTGMLNVVENYRKHIPRAEVQFDYLYFHDLENTYQKAIEDSGGRTFYFPIHRSAKTVAAIEDFFSRHDGEFDILHCHPPFAPQLFGRAAKRHGVKRVIAHSHSTKFSLKRISAARNWALSKLLGFYATDYIACSDDARILLGRHGDDAFILHNAIDCTKFTFNSASRKDVRSEIGASDDCVLLGSVGRLSPEKNQLLMLDVLSELKSRGVACKLVVAGSGRCERALVNKRDELGLGNDFILLGSRADTPRLYSAFDAFLLSSFFEGMPVSALEAQACGLPCFLSDAITREAGIGNARFLPIDEGAIPWADAIMSSGLDRASVETAHSQIRESAFDISVEAVKLSEFYRSILNDNRKLD